MAYAGERERPIEAHGNLARRREQTVAREARDKLMRRAHRSHGM
jgi:hypothetical protein